MASHQKIIARIKAVREELGWSQAELSRRMKQVSNTVQKIESGFIKNPEKYLPQIAEATKKPLSYFFGEESPELTEYAEKAKKYDALIDLIKDSGILGGGSNSSINNNGGDGSLAVGGNGNNVNVNGDAAKIVQELMKKDHEEHELIWKILELEKGEKDKLFQLYEMLKKKDK